MQTNMECLVETIGYTFGFIKFMIQFHIRKVVFYAKDYSSSLLREYDDFVFIHGKDEPLGGEEIDGSVEEDSRVEPLSTQEPVLIENLPEVKETVGLKED